MNTDLLVLDLAKIVPFETTQVFNRLGWEKHAARMFRDLCSGSLGPAPIQTGWQMPQPRRLDRLCDVHLTWSNFFIAGDACTSIYGSPEVAVAGIVDWPDLAETASIYRHGQGFVTSRARLEEAERVGGRTLLASSDEPHNWGMFLLYTVPAVVHFIENRDQYDHLLVFAGHSNMKAMLRLLGLTHTDYILHHCNKAYHLESVDVFRQPQREFSIAPEVKATFAKLREKVAGSVSKPSALHLYVGRRRRTVEMNSYRGLTNEVELMDRLATMGYTTIDPEYLSPDQQIELFGSARSIVALGGAGLFNALFCRPGTKIIDIESNRDHIDNHSTILSSMDLDYGMIIGQVAQDDPASHNRRWTVDVDRAAAAVEEFMSVEP